MNSARDFGIRVSRRTGNEEICYCPFHSDDTPSASYNIVKGLFYCHVCKLGLGLVQLQKLLGGEEFQLNQEPVDYDLLQSEFELGDEKYTDYFSKRGIPPWVIDLFGVRWRDTPESAVFPIRDFNGRLQGAMYRYLKGGTRYIMQGKPTPIWPMPLMRRRNESVVVVVEGAWSAMRLATANVFSVALLGAKANQVIADTLRSIPCVFLYDGDPAGRKACLRMRELLPFSPAWTLSISPDDMYDDQLYQLKDRLIRKGIKV